MEKNIAEKFTSNKQEHFKTRALWRARGEK